MDGLPVYAVALQDFLDLVIFSYVPKPAVQLGEDNQVNQAGLHVREQPLKLRTLRRALAGGDAGVDVVPGHLNPAGLRPGVQRLPLGLDGQAVDRLLFCADADVQRRAGDRAQAFFNFHVDFLLFCVVK